MPGQIVAFIIGKCFLRAHLVGGFFQAHTPLVKRVKLAPNNATSAVTMPMAAEHTLRIQQP